MEKEELIKENRTLREQIVQLQKELAIAKQQPLHKDNNNSNNNNDNTNNNLEDKSAMLTTSVQEDPHHFSHHDIKPLQQIDKLSNYQIARYGRHLLLPDFGVKGQRTIAGKSVMVIGAGGLGCPVSLYLSTSGIGRIGIIDYDVVEESNLHRQVVHPESNVGISKSLSIKKEVLRRNSKVECIAYDGVLTAENALDILRPYDVIIDASDNVPTRYLVNDACVVLGKPLVSGSALKWEGQVSVYNHKNGPCYRCIFPTPPDPNTVTRCSDGGVMGAVTGIIGCIQALEAIKILSDCGDTLHGKLLFFDGISSVFRTVKLRTKQPSCAVCGDNPTITEKLVDYPVFCGTTYSDKAEKAENSIPQNQIISCKDYNLLKNSNHILLDVRDPVQYDICALPNSLSSGIDTIKQKLSSADIPVYVVCRRGWDSQTAVEILFQQGIKNGGLLSWAESVDVSFPIY